VETYSHSGHTPSWANTNDATVLTPSV
jgi:hypothetical protein